MIIPIEDKKSVISRDTAVEIHSGDLEGREVSSTRSIEMCAQLNRWMPLVVGLILGATICAVSLYGGIEKHDWGIAAAGTSFSCVVLAFSVFLRFIV